MIYLKVMPEHCFLWTVTQSMGYQDIISYAIILIGILYISFFVWQLKHS